MEGGLCTTSMDTPWRMYKSSSYWASVVRVFQIILLYSGQNILETSLECNSDMPIVMLLWDGEEYIL